MSDRLTAIYEAVIQGEEGAVREGVEAALKEQTDPGSILNRGMIAAMVEVGRQYESGDCFVPEMLMAARAMKSGLELLSPALAAAKVEAVGKVLIGSVEGDLHDIGKNLVAMMLAGVGFEVIDLGVNVPPRTFVDGVRQHAPDLVGLSALLTTTMPNIKATIDALSAAGLRSGVQVMIGGAPVSEDFVPAAGADFYAPDASSAARRAKEVMSRLTGKAPGDSIQS
jgi:5-methyltetrahydrofolate--homocysteine methyltransferase